MSSSKHIIHWHPESKCLCTSFGVFFTWISSNNSVVWDTWNSSSSFNLLIRILAGDALARRRRSLSLHREVFWFYSLWNWPAVGETFPLTRDLAYPKPSLQSYSVRIEKKHRMDIKVWVWFGVCFHVLQLLPSKITPQSYGKHRQNWMYRTSQLDSTIEKRSSW